MQNLQALQFNEEKGLIIIQNFTENSKVFNDQLRMAKFSIDNSDSSGI